MILLSPIWLLGLLPWAVVSVYLLSGQRRRVEVPFLALWSGPAAPPKAKRAIHRPPWFILFLILSLLLAVLAAAGPAVRSNHSSDSRFTIILDRGITMSPLSTRNEPFRGVVALAAPALQKRFDHQPVDFVPVPGEARSTNASDWAVLAMRMPPTAMDTQGALRQTVAECLRRKKALPVLVLTDRRLDEVNDQLMQIPPTGDAVGTKDVGIAAVAARSQPTPQVMIRLRNQSHRREIHLRIVSGNQQVDQAVALPIAGNTQDYFIDIPGGLSDSVRVEIEPDDIAPVNDRAWLARESSWPVVQARTPLPMSVQRMIDVYGKSRPGNETSRHATVGFDAVPDGQGGVWIQRERSALNRSMERSSTATVVPQAVTAHVANWPGAADLTATLPSGFTPVVSRAGHPLVAVHENPAQVWVNLDLDSWSTSPDFVIFFTNVFDWIGNGANPEYRAHPVARLGKEWKRADDSPVPAGVENGLWPGLYRRGDGTLLAINAPDTKWEQPLKTGWQAKLARQQTGGAVKVSLAPDLCAAAVIAGMLAAGFWLNHPALRAAAKQK